MSSKRTVAVHTDHPSNALLSRKVTMRKTGGRVTEQTMILLQQPSWASPEKVFAFVDYDLQKCSNLGEIWLRIKRHSQPIVAFSLLLRIWTAQFHIALFPEVVFFTRWKSSPARMIVSFQFVEMVIFWITLERALFWNPPKRKDGCEVIAEAWLALSRLLPEIILLVFYRSGLLARLLKPLCWNHS